METAPGRRAPLSNAERQRRWRERLKARASGAAVADHARDAVAQAVAALWAYHERPGPGGTRWAEIDGCRSIEAYLEDLSAEDGGLLATARAFVPGFEGLTPEEARAVAMLVELADILALRDPASSGVLARLLARADQPPAPPRKRRARAPAPVPTAVPPAEPAAEPVRLSAARRARRHGLRQKWR